MSDLSLDIHPNFEKVNSSSFNKFQKRQKQLNDYLKYELIGLKMKYKLKMSILQTNESILLQQNREALIQ